MGTFRICRGLAAVVIACLAAGPASAELNLWIAYNYQGADAYGNGDYYQSAEVLLEALDENVEPFRRAETLDILGRVYNSLGRFEEAEAALKEALALKEKSLGKNHRFVAETLNSLADLYYVWKRDSEDIEGLYRRALEINKRDQYNIEVCRSFNGLALIHNDRGEVVEAEKLLKQAATLHHRAERRDNPYLATVLVNLGILYTKLGRYSEAYPKLDRAQFIQETELRPDHPDLAVRLAAQALLMQETGQASAAMALANEAEAIRQKQTAAGNAF